MYVVLLQWLCGLLRLLQLFRVDWRGVETTLIGNQQQCTHISRQLHQTLSHHNNNIHIYRTMLVQQFVTLRMVIWVCSNGVSKTKAATNCFVPSDWLFKGELWVYFTHVCIPLTKIYYILYRGRQYVCYSTQYILYTILHVYMCVRNSLEMELGHFAVIRCSKAF